MQSSWPSLGKEKPGFLIELLLLKIMRRSTNRHFGGRRVCEVSEVLKTKASICRLFSPLPPHACSVLSANNPHVFRQVFGMFKSTPPLKCRLLHFVHNYETRFQIKMILNFMRGTSNIMRCGSVILFLFSSFCFKLCRT